jgi:RimJ/RimL family protein N-acetyltransferase
MMDTDSATQGLRLVDLDTYEPTDAEILARAEIMAAPDQLLWQYGDSYWKEPRSAEEEVRAFRQRQRDLRGRNHSFLAIVDGKVVGMIGVNRPDHPGRTHCGELGYGVAAPFTRQGIGSRLFAAAIRKAREVGLKRLEV